MPKSPLRSQRLDTLVDAYFESIWISESRAVEDPRTKIMDVTLLSRGYTSGLGSGSSFAFKAFRLCFPRLAKSVAENKGSARLNPLPCPCSYMHLNTALRRDVLLLTFIHYVKSTNNEYLVC